MNKNDGWLKASTDRLTPMVRAKIVAGATPANAEAHVKDTDNPDPSLTIWQRTSTTVVAEHDTGTGAAVLPKNIVGHDSIPRVARWRKILICPSAVAGIWSVDHRTVG
ncbi:hypothetical protein DFO46_1685 [Rhizobium sp. AG855]|nr:hypothetical protein DFO46_1685 [Rhizobium sp. AG855]